MIYLQILVIAVVLVIGYFAFSRYKPKGCAICGGMEDKCGCEDFLTGKEKKYLLFITKLPLGATFEQVKMVFPQAADVKGEGDLREGRSQLNIPVKIVNKTAYINFIFESGELKNYYFWLKDLREAESFNLFNSIKMFYNEKFYEVPEATGKDKKEMIWLADDFRVKLKYIRNDINAVSWGFESIDQ